MPSVVLPDPDSPTIPIVSPRFTSMLASCTAANARERSQPSRILNSTSTPCADTITGVSGGMGCTSRRGRLSMRRTV